MTFADHRHISEREMAHDWPDGQHDDRHWEDCTFCAGVMLARICHNALIPATLTEAEHLRDVAGEDPLGGTSTADLIRGIRARYPSFTQFQHVAGFEALWAALDVGFAAAAQGSMGAFPVGHTLRRHDPGFDGAHDVLVVRLDDTDRVWWDDPLAPIGDYRGQWVSKADLARYVRGFSGSHLVARHQETTDMSIYRQDKTPGRFVIPAGTSVRGYKPSGSDWAVAKTWDARTTESSAPFTAVLRRISGTVTPSVLLKVEEGFFAGLYVSSADVDETIATPVESGITQAELDAAKSAATAAEAALAATRASLTSVTTRLRGVKSKVAALAADVSND